MSAVTPEALAERCPEIASSLSSAQLEVLRLVLEKEEGEERDEIGHGINWLAIIATVIEHALTLN